MNALQVIGHLPTTKQEKESFIIEAIREIVSGEKNPLEIDLKLKFIADTFDEIRKNIHVKNAVERETDKYSEKKFTYGQFEITKVSTRKNDFVGVDEVLDGLYSQMETLKGVIKAREATVLTGINPDTGEAFKPVRFTETNSLRVSLKNG